jgi:DNA-binding NtrC family response regulator
LHALERALLFLDNEQRLRNEAGEEKLTLTLPVGEGVKPVRNRAEEQLLRQVLEETAYNIHETARRLNLNRENVYYLLKKYGIKRPQKDG